MSNCAPIDSSLPCCFNVVPKEIVLYGFSFLDPKQICKLRKVSQYIRDLIDQSLSLPCNRIPFALVGEERDFIANAIYKSLMEKEEREKEERDLIASTGYEMSKSKLYCDDPCDSAHDFKFSYRKFSIRHKIQEMFKVDESVFESSINGNTTETYNEIAIAASKGSSIAVKLLLKMKDFQGAAAFSQADMTEATILASNNDQTELTPLLIKHSFPLLKSLFLQDLIEKNGVETVQALLSDINVDPSFNDNAAMKKAIKQSNGELIKLLTLDPRLDALGKAGALTWTCYSVGEKEHEPVSTEIFKSLIADPVVLARQGITQAFDSAIQYENISALEILLIQT